MMAKRVLGARFSLDPKTVIKSLFVCKATKSIAVGAVDDNHVGIPDPNWAQNWHKTLTILDEL
ncbi:MAG TPA: hypothetical protein VG056_01500, partial [Pirellulales bacterium]|nr:hypothetical protein [Pirellulales bacterium]